jgi:hypothetical protein
MKPRRRARPRSSPRRICICPTSARFRLFPTGRWLVPARLIARNAYLIDPRMVSLGVFDDISIEKPAKTGDAEKRVLVTEYTLLVNNEAAHGVIADIFGLTAST